MLKKIDKIAEWLFLLLLIIQFGFIAYFNLSDIRCSLDYDCANTFYHYMEVIKNGTMKLADWNHTTSLELEGAFLFAVPLYFLTKDIFLAVGIGNIILAALFILVISRILYYANVSKKLTYFTLCLVITPYSYGMLEYFNMLFYGTSWYSIRTLVPLIFVLMLQILAKKEYSGKYEKAELVGASVLYVAFLYVTSFSGGIYTMLCGIVPLAGCMVIDIWTNGKIKGAYNWKHVVMLAGTVVVFLIGNKMNGIYNGEVSRTNMNLTKIENYAINFRACVAGLLQVFGATTSEDVNVLSFWGIVYCLKMAFVVLLVIAFVFNFSRIFQKTEKLDIRKHLAFVFLFNFLVLLMADCRYSNNTHTEYRYFLIGVVPLILLLGIQISEWKKVWNDFQYRLIYVGLFIALAGLVIGNNANIIKKWDRSTYAVEVCDYINTLDVESVFFVNDPDTSIICKGIDDKHKYGAYLSDSQSLYLGYCSYKSSAYGSFYGNKNALAVINWYTIEDVIPPEIAQHYVKVGTVRWFDIYVADEVYF